MHFIKTWSMNLYVFEFFVAKLAILAHYHILHQSFADTSRLLPGQTLHTGHICSTGLHKRGTNTAK